MTKFWTMAMVIVACLSAGIQTGCLEGDDDYDGDVDSDAGADSDADSDADADSDTTEDDADTAEDTACPACPNVAGDWALTYHSDTTGADWNCIYTLQQVGSLVTGYNDCDSCEWSGNISESGYLSTFEDCAGDDSTVTGNLVNPDHLEGEWYSTRGRGTWYADRQ